MAISEKDLDVLTRTVWAESRGEGIAGMVAVGWAIRNRVEMDLHNDGKPDWWGEGYEGVCKAPWQFSCWNKNDPNYPYMIGEKEIPRSQYALALDAAKSATSERTDPTMGATHYFSTTMPKAPAWAAKATRTIKIGRHIFFKNVP